MVSQWNSSGIFYRIHHIAALLQSPRVHVKYERTTSRFHWTDFLHVDVQRHLMGIQRKLTGMRIKRPTRFSLCEKIFTRTMVIPRTWIRKEMVFYSRIQSTRRMGHSCGANDVNNRRKQTSSFPVLRVHCHKERSKAKVVENYQYTFALTRERLKLFFAQLFLLTNSVFYGSVSDLCDECKSCPVTTGRLVLVGQSDPLYVPTSVIKTPIPSTDDPAQEDLLRKNQERVDKLSQQNRVIKLCIDAGFLTTVDVGQYFMTKDTEEFSQFTDSVACREYTLPRDEKSSDPKGWIRGNTKIGPVLEVATCYLQGKYGVEIRIESVNKDNSHSWVRISHGLN